MSCSPETEAGEPQSCYPAQLQTHTEQLLYVHISVINTTLIPCMYSIHKLCKLKKAKRRCFLHSSQACGHCTSRDLFLFSTRNYTNRKKLLVFCYIVAVCTETVTWLAALHTLFFFLCDCFIKV